MARPAHFAHPHRPWEEIEADVRAWMAAHPGVYVHPHGAMHNYFHNILVPPSLRWALKSVDKTGSTSLLRVLHELEWGTPFTVEMVAPDDINPDSAVHRQMDADILRRVAQVRGGISGLPGMLRLTSVRHPSLRAVSSFLYLCLTQERRATWMVNDRIRMGAMVGFDWSVHARQPEGFLRFLDYVLLWRQEKGVGAVDTHWRPQWALIRPDLFRPDLIGRAENLTPFVQALALRLDQPIPVLTRANEQNRYDPSPFLAHPGVRERLAKLYRADYETFGYDPDEVPTP